MEQFQDYAEALMLLTETKTNFHTCEMVEENSLEQSILVRSQFAAILHLVFPRKNWLVSRFRTSVAGSAQAPTIISDVSF